MCKVNFLEFQGCNHTPWHSAQRCPQFANNPDPQATCKLPSPTLEKGYHLFPDILCVKCFPDPEYKNLAKCDVDTIKRWNFWKDPSITEAKVQRLIAASPPEDTTQQEESKSSGFSLRKTIGKTKKAITNVAKDNFSKVGLSRHNSEKSRPLSNDSTSSSPGPSEDSEGPRLLSLQFQLSQLNQLKVSRDQSGNESVMTGMSANTKWDDVVKEGNDFGSSSWEATIEARKAREAEKQARHESVQAEFDREMELVHAKQKNEMALRRRRKRLAASDETQPSSGDLRQRRPPRIDADKPLPKPSDFPLPEGVLKASNEQSSIQQNRQHNKKGLRQNPFVPAPLQPMREVDSIRSESSDDEDISMKDSYSRRNQAEASELYDTDEIGHSQHHSRGASRPGSNYDPQSTEEARPQLRPGNTFPISFQEEECREERPLQLRHGKTFSEPSQRGNSRLQDKDMSCARVGNTDHATNSPLQKDSNNKAQGQQASTSALTSDTKGSGSSFPKVPTSKFNNSTSSNSSRSENTPEDSSSDYSDAGSNPREVGFSRQQDNYGGEEEELYSCLDKYSAELYLSWIGLHPRETDAIRPSEDCRCCNKRYGTQTGHLQRGQEIQI
jgi:hypothetical protein